MIVLVCGLDLKLQHLRVAWATFSGGVPFALGLICYDVPGRT